MQPRGCESIDRWWQICRLFGYIRQDQGSAPVRNDETDPGSRQGRRPRPPPLRREGRRHFRPRRDRPVATEGPSGRRRLRSDQAPRPPIGQQARGRSLVDGPRLSGPRSPRRGVEGGIRYGRSGVGRARGGTGGHRFDHRTAQPGEEGGIGPASGEGTRPIVGGEERRQRGESAPAGDTGTSERGQIDSRERPPASEPRHRGVDARPHPRRHRGGVGVEGTAREARGHRGHPEGGEEGALERHRGPCRAGRHAGHEGGRRGRSGPRRRGPRVAEAGAGHRGRRGEGGEIAGRGGQ
mmetsp:Transcript_44870/g.137045  ORF Transcript_44870/g.137045 Transcript_44870/m.137045 type:complete len:295 (+) Transcript_44870:547-1431(+)